MWYKILNTLNTYYYIMTLKNEKTGIDVTDDVCNIFSETCGSIDDLVSLTQEYTSLIADYTTTFNMMKNAVTKFDTTTSDDIEDCYDSLLNVTNAFVDLIRSYERSIEIDRVSCKEIVKRK